MSGYLYKTISTLAHDLATTYDGRLKSPESRVDVVNFVLEQLARMPWFLRIGVMLGTAVFGANRVFFGGTPFHRQKSKNRAAQTEAWKRSRLAICRDLMKFYTSLVALAVYSETGTECSRDVS
jgi:hypothetical protein